MNSMTQLKFATANVKFLKKTAQKMKCITRVTAPANVHLKNLTHWFVDRTLAGVPIPATASVTPKAKLRRDATGLDSTLILAYVNAQTLAFLRMNPAGQIQKLTC